MRVVGYHLIVGLIARSRVMRGFSRAAVEPAKFGTSLVTVSEFRRMEERKKE
jgi:hypothetical protein